MFMRHNDRQTDTSLDAMLADDLIQMMMKADAVDPAAVRTLFQSVMHHRPLGAVAAPHRQRPACRGIASRARALLHGCGR